MNLHRFQIRVLRKDAFFHLDGYLYLAVGLDLFSILVYKGDIQGLHAFIQHILGL